MDPCNSLALDQQSDNLPVFEVPTKSLFDCSNVKVGLSDEEMSKIEYQRLIGNIGNAGTKANERENTIRKRILSIERFSTSIVVSKLAQMIEYLSLVNFTKKSTILVAYDDEFLQDWQMIRFDNLTRQLANNEKFSRKDLTFKIISTDFTKHSEGFRIFKGTVQVELKKLNQKNGALLYMVMIGQVSELKSIFFELTESTETSTKIAYTSRIRWLALNWVGTSIDAERQNQNTGYTGSLLQKRTKTRTVAATVPMLINSQNTEQRAKSAVDVNSYKSLITDYGLSAVFDMAPGYNADYKKFLLETLDQVLSEFRKILNSDASIYVLPLPKNIDPKSIKARTANLKLRDYKNKDTFGFQKTAYKIIMNKLKQTIEQFSNKRFRNGHTRRYTGNLIAYHPMTNSLGDFKRTERFIVPMLENFSKISSNRKKSSSVSLTNLGSFHKLPAHAKNKTIPNVFCHYTKYSMTTAMKKFTVVTIHDPPFMVIKENPDGSGSGFLLRGNGDFLHG